MKRFSLFLVAVTLVGVVGCGARWKTVVLDERSYVLSVAQSATIGDPMVVRTSGTMYRWERRKQKEANTSLMFSAPQEWIKESGEQPGDDFVRKELIYSGKAGSIVEFAYREFRSDLAAPAFYQNVKYDLSESTTISFQEFRIQVIEATNQAISFKVISD